MSPPLPLAPDAAEELDEALLIVRAQSAADVALVDADHRLELPQHRGAVVAEPERVRAAVIGRGRADDEAARLQAVDHGDDGGAIDAQGVAELRLAQAGIAVDHHEHAELAGRDVERAHGFAEMLKYRYLRAPQLIT